MNGGLLSLIQADMVLDTFTIQTQDSIDIAREKLAWQIGDKPSPFTINSTQVILYGEVSEDGFRLCRIKGRGQPITILNGWFEAVQLGTVVHLEVELNLSVVIVYLLFFLCVVTKDWQRTIKNLDGSLTFYTGMMIVITISSIVSCQDEMRFYRKKLTQIFCEHQM